MNRDKKREKSQKKEIIENANGKTTDWWCGIGFCYIVWLKLSDCWLHKLYVHTYESIHNIGVVLRKWKENLTKLELDI